MIELSPYHEIFFNEWKLNPIRSDYNIVIDNEIHGKLDPHRMDQALLRMSEDFLLLHSKIEEVGGKCYWIPDSNLRVEFKYLDHPLNDQELVACVRSPFNLHKDVPFRVALIRMERNRYRIILVFHHIIMDSAKEDFVCEVLPLYYNDSHFHIQLSLNEQYAKFRQFSEKYSQWMRETENDHKQFWSEQLEGLPGVDLGFLKPAEKSANIDGNAICEMSFFLDSAKLDVIKLAAKKYATTPYLLSLSIFAIALFKHTQQSRLGLCIPIAISDGGDFIYGSNISPTVFLFELNHTTTVTEALNAAKRYFKLIKSKNHYHFPLQKISSTIVDKDLFGLAFTQTNLKDIRFNFQGTHWEIANTRLNVDLAGKLLFAQEIKNGRFNFRVMFKQDFIDFDLLSNFTNTYQHLLDKIPSDLIQIDESKSLCQYRAIDDYQIALINEWNKTGKLYPSKTIHKLFEEQVERTPDAIALIFQDVHWSYAELNARANRLAHYLQHSFSIQIEDIVGICMQPSHHMIVALWAVLKVGGAYVPIDHTYPDERVRFILSDTQTKLVITDKPCSDRFGHLFEQLSKIDVINLDDHKAYAAIKNKPPTNPNSLTRPTNLAYVIYTSGTLGTPKGVQIEHHSVVNYVTDLIQFAQLSEKSVGAKYAAFSFDCSVIEIYPILLSGGKLCVIKENDRMDCKKVNDFLHQHQVTYAFFPTPFAELFYELKNESLKTLMVGGSKLNRYVKAPYRIVNVYGPTEATVQATIITVDRDYENIPIGKPMYNVKCYVVDQYLQQVPIGAVGELLIGGEGVARGYLNLPELTEQRFIANPFRSQLEINANKNSRVYKTGDLVRWLQDGNLEYVGRNDSQVKIKGYRVELGEIEHRILQYPSIQQAAVTATVMPGKFGEKQLVAYYVAPCQINSTNLKENLRQYLPDYLIPTIFVQMEKMPLTTSGKIDKSLMPSPAVVEDQQYIAPTSLLEEIVCSAFSQVLGLDKQDVGIHCDFFELGGDSVAAIRLSYMLGRHLKLSVANIFELKTPAKIASNVQANGSESIIQNIEQLRLLYQNKLAFALNDWELMENSKALPKHQQYIDNINRLKTDLITRKDIRAVMLTGATGFLGCHLLKALLSNTQYRIFLPVRGNSDETALKRLNQQFQYYFAEDLEKSLDRIWVFSARLDEKRLGLQSVEFDNLVNQVDSIIHCAALVKYEGIAEEYRLSNIQPTINLLEFAKQTKTKDFHYISTIGVLLDGHIVDQDFVIFNEDDDLIDFVRGDHPYIESKYQAEQHVLKYRLQGVNGSIYRIGNLVMNSQSYAVQKNIEENMFFAHLNSLLQFKTIPKEISQIEASPVDCTALAIIKLFDKVSLSNQIHHVFNPITCDLRRTLEHFEHFRKLKCTLDEFIDEVMRRIETGNDSGNFSNLLMLYELWLREIDGNHSTRIRISQQKTSMILLELGFSWPKLSPNMFEKFVSSSRP